MNEAANQNWTTRALERQIGTLYYERLLASPDRSAVEQEALSNLTPLQRTPREFVRDPVMLEFLGLPTLASYWRAIWNKGCSAICRNSCLSWGRASLS